MVWCSTDDGEQAALQTHSDAVEVKGSHTPEQKEGAAPGL